MTLDEAIKQLQESVILNEYQALDIRHRKIDGWEKSSEQCQSLAKYRRQIAEWLKELKSYREMYREQNQDKGNNEDIPMEYFESGGI